MTSFVEDGWIVARGEGRDVRTWAAPSTSEQFRERDTSMPARSALIGATVALGLLLSGCTSNAEPGASASPPATPSSPSEPSSPATSPTSVPAQSPSLNAEYALTINIEIAGGKTVPNGNKIDVRVDQKVILNVISDTDDEIHAHLGEKDYELAVQAGKPAKGSFTLDSRGSFEVESHHLEKTIVILNAR
jgi:hypothetical protein